MGLFAPGDPIEVLELLRDLGVTVTLDRPRGELHVRPRPIPALERELITANRALLYDVLLGAHTGHVWTRCDKCGAGMMRKRGAKQRKCAFTPRCEGRHQVAAMSPVTDARSSRVDHPARFSTELLPALAKPLADWRLPVHDCFAGTGERLGHLCDELGLPFTGTEIEHPFIVDARVRRGDSTEARAYPTGEYVVATSPSYPNGMADHFKASDVSKRNTYRAALARTIGYDRELHPNNTARYNNRRGERIERQYWHLMRQAVAHWPDHVVVNVKDHYYTRDGAEQLYPTVAKWIELLESYGYAVARDDVKTPGQQFGANRHRVETEAVLVCERSRP
jgi:hypothetical protein